MLELTVPLDVSREAKNAFVAEHLVPYLRTRAVPYALSRKVLVFPVSVVHLREPAEGREALRADVQALVDSFVAELPEQALRPAADYVALWDDVKKIHRLEVDAPPVDRVVECRHVSYAERRGEYYRPEDAEIFTHFSFVVQPLVERTLAHLEEDRARREIPFLVGLFATTSRLFTVDGDVRGHLSFKSHVIGFFRYSHEGLPAYAKSFRGTYERSADALAALRARVEAGAASRPDDPLLTLLGDWAVELERLREALWAVRETRQRTFLRSFRAQLDYLQFRRLSTFHAKAFGRVGQKTLSSREFGAYRMCVNFVYLLLPTLGLSTRKRVLAAYLLVRSVEHPADFLTGVVPR